MRRWFVDPLTSFDAGAIALAVAEGRKRRQPKQLPGSLIDDAEAKELAEQITHEIEKQLESEGKPIRKNSER